VKSRARRLSILLAAAFCTSACTAEASRLPAAEELSGLYGGEQDPAQIRHGGTLWAKVGPYIFLFSPQTQEVFERFPAVAAVRVRTFANQVQLAEAMLKRDELNSVTWREANRRVAKARLEGTRSPGHLEALVRYGEDHTEFEYAPRFRED
jgi:hypothetical protein